MTSRQERRQALAKLAGRQEGVASIERLYDLGFTYAEVRQLVALGHLQPLHRGVYAVGHRRIGHRGWLRAALLACGPDSFLSHRTAAALRGLAALNTFEIHVTIPGLGGSRRYRRIVVHRTRNGPHPGEVTTTIGLRVATVPLLLLQLAPRESRAELGRMIDLAVRRGSLRLKPMDGVLKRYPRAPGAAILKKALASYRPRTFAKSGLERDVAAAIAADPSIPEPQRNVHLEAGGIRWEIDFWWAEHRVALEVDGSQYHLTPQDRERDRLKDAKLLAVAITLLRVTDVRWEHDARGALSDLRAVLALSDGRNRENVAL